MAPALVQTLQMRHDAVTPASYDKEFAARQRAAYPDIAIRSVTSGFPAKELGVAEKK